MRWSEQLIEQAAGTRLPGYRDATVRHFDAPEAVGTRFYEVAAKSILNRVPEQSQVPFRWTVNPYRGCSHACAYCLQGDTRILMADGTVTPIRDLRVGDRIVGTVRDGAYRRMVETTVQAKWSSLKPAYEIGLSDGTVVVASGDHRFLSDRGWKHVTGTQQGSEQRPHLTLNNRLLGPGGDAEPPMHGRDYMLGYLCGMVRGDGHLASHRYVRTNGRPGVVHQFRLALADAEALHRTERFLSRLDVETTEFAFSAATAARRPMSAIRTQRRASVERIGQLTAWPIEPAVGWWKGFLAGIFDAEGGTNDHVVRISNTDPKLLAWIRRAMTALGFGFVEERGAGRASNIRLVGGMSERLRFYLTIDPAITRKRSMIGVRIKSATPKQVASIRPLGQVMRMFDITTGTEDFIANGVIAHNCFARPTHEFLGWDAGRDFEREIVVKVNAPERLAAELRRPSWTGEHVALGTNTDPYQWVEGRYELMRGIWAALRDARNPCSVLTKSPLLTRDLDLMRELDRVTDFSAALSIPTLDAKAWRATEPRTPNPRARLEALAELTAAGIRTGVLVAPLMPGINDDPKQVREIIRLATEAGAAYISGLGLHLRGSVREVFLEWLAEARPDLLDRYTELYRGGAYLPMAERRRLEALLVNPLPGESEWRRGLSGPPDPPVAEPVQASLF